MRKRKVTTKDIITVVIMAIVAIIMGVLGHYLDKEKKPPTRDYMTLIIGQDTVKIDSKGKRIEE